MINILRDIVDNQNTAKGKVFDWTIQVLIIYSLITFSLETIPNLSDSLVSFLYYSELVCISIFTIEYALRIIAAKKRARFVFSFYGLVDLAAILPFFLTGLDMRAIRSVRIFRLLRLLKFFRYSEASTRLQKAFKIVKDEMFLFVFATAILLFLSATGIYYFEHNAQPEKFASVFHSLWWAVATLTSVGYGDIYPITIGGQIFTFFVLMIGLGVVAVPAGLVASALAKVRLEESEKDNSEKFESD